MSVTLLYVLAVFSEVGSALLAIGFQQGLTEDKEILHKIVGTFYSFDIRALKQYATWRLLV